MIQPGIAKVAIPGAAVALVATGSAAALPDQEVKLDTPIASSSLQLAREAAISRDALRPPLNLSTPTPKPKAAAPTAKHLKKQAPIPKPAAAKTRAAVKAATPPKVVGSKYTTTDLNVWSVPVVGTLLDVVPKGTKVSVTGKVDGIWAEIVRDGRSRWVKARYLSATKPVAKTAASTAGTISQSACKSGSGVEDGLTQDAIRVHRAVCAKFPDITSYGGLRAGDSGSEHSTGRALDIMVTGSRGDEIADWLRANYKKLGISELIWEQKIWTVQRGSEGWRGMEDRGGATANHMDHVHVSVYGNEGTV
ncbi:SH3 domain-containing protein [Kribbella turkmenica]|uniref:SH3 domain-containing protein n=1 Tax=Kribbella turkmenica TaxID=2530375 RepID=A0A4R4X182_9ACTN|nr:SH3 domain-containing protein [Kribbella turkmenica]TDD23936.1 SH3 domain-containing protein [Kribbella turkmenica]